MKRTTFFAALALAALCAQTGCSAVHSPVALAPPAHYPASAPPPPEPPAASPTPAASPPAEGAPASPKPPAQDAKGAAPKAAEARAAKGAGPTARAPVIIYQGELRMVADEEAIAKTIDRIIDAAESLGGRLAGRKDQSVQVKVPSASFRDALAKIEAVGGVVSRSVAADDVSEEFHDLEVRLANLRATRQRLQEFLAKAGGIQDMLAVERELERVAQELDRAEGRLEFLRSRAAMSLISVNLSARPKAPPVAPALKPPLRPASPPVAWVAEVGIDPLLSLKK